MSSIQSSITTESEVITTVNLTNVTVTESNATLNVTMAANSSIDDNESITYSQTNSTTYTPNHFTNYTVLENVTATLSTSEGDFNKTTAQSSSYNVSTTTNDPLNYSTSIYTTVTFENETMSDTDTTQSIVTNRVTDDINRTEYTTVSESSDRETTDYFTTNTGDNSTVVSTYRTQAPKGSPDAGSTTNNSAGSEIGKFHR